MSEVKKIFSSRTVKLIVAKPLVETQNANSLIENFPGAKIIWMFRNYKSVAKSNISHFGLNNGKRNLSFIINNDTTNWRSEKISHQTKTIVDELYNEINTLMTRRLYFGTQEIFFFMK